MRVILQHVSHTYRGRGRQGVEALAGVTFTVEPEELVAVVGPSGCGKSTLLNMLAGLLSPTEGRVGFEGHLPSGRPPTAMVFQEFALFPWRTVQGNVEFGLEEAGVPAAERHATARRYVELAGLGGFERKYPHELSGGMRQRVGIARALAVEPSLIVCDEPVSALDVSIQAQIINLLEDLQAEFRLTYLFIAHDLAVVRHISDRVAVMYLGKIVEVADRRELYDTPLHPYTKALLAAVPIPDPVLEAERPRTVLAGEVPSPLNPPSGCVFHPRCPIAVDRCRGEVPPLREVTPGHWAACLLA